VRSPGTRVAQVLGGAARGATPLIPLAPGVLPVWLSDADPAARRWVAARGFVAEAGTFCVVPQAEAGAPLVLAGVDPDDPGSVSGFAALGAGLGAGRYRISASLTADAASRAALGWALGTYRFERYRGAEREPGRLVWPVGADRDAVRATAEATYLVRDLINTPANDLGPAELAAAARSLARRFGGRVTVTAGARLREEYPAVHAVGRASRRPPRLVDLRWGRRGPTITLVGKGVCFDSGGLDLKSAAGMKLMKKDMGGAAHVLGLAHMIMAARLRVRLRVLIPAVENAVSGDALRPLDVIRTRRGLTVEVGNTDAEGRLILADALAAAGRPDLLVDFATLTGAARVALGTELPALFCNDDDLAARLLACSASEDDPVWRLPLHVPYARLLRSSVADLGNVADGPYAGAIVAALFLERFVDPATPWIHLDVMAWNVGGVPGRPEGGEAMGMRAVFRLVEELARMA